MATPYEFVARELRAQFPDAHLVPDSATPDAHQLARLYLSDATLDYAHLHLSYPGGYPFYYPTQLTLPGRPPLALRLVAGADAIQAFTRPGGEIRRYLARYGYWRIEASVNPATTDFWLLLLGPAGPEAQYLILPTHQLRQLLSRAHNPEKFSLLLAKAGFCFAGQPLTAAARLAVLQNPVLLDTPDFAGLDMRPYLNNWQQLAA